MENIKRPGTGWYIGGVTLKENGGTQNEYRIDIVRCGIHIKKNNQMILHLDFSGFIDYHISDYDFIIEYDGYWDSPSQGYGNKELHIYLKNISDSDKENLRLLMKKVDGEKKFDYKCVKPKKVQSKVGNEGIIAMRRGYLKWGNTDKAEKSAKEALKIHPTLDCYLLLLDVYEDMDDEVAFKATCEEALKHIDNAEERAILNERIENSSQITENKSEVTEKTMKLPMRVSFEFAPGQRIGFDFDVNLTENEIRELAREFLNNEDAYHDFEMIKRMHEPLYNKIRSCGENAIKNEIKIAWGDDADDFLGTNFRDCKIHVHHPLYMQTK